MINNLGIGVVELSLNCSGDARCGNSLDKAAPRQRQTVMSFCCGHDGSVYESFRLNRPPLANQVLAESARVTTAAPSMMASLMISRPAPER